MRTRSTFCLALSLAAVSIFAFYAVRGSGAAQQPSSQQPMATLKVQAREVLLPVVVVDKHGALVTNLTAKDFTLSEDGRPQTIKSFTSQSNLPFRLGLLVDTSRSVYSAMDSERKAAGKFVDLMLPADPDRRFRRGRGPGRRSLPHSLRPRGRAPRRLHQLARQAAPRARPDDANLAGAQQPGP